MSAGQMMAHLHWCGAQVTKPESLILQRHRTIPAPLQLPKADKASVLVGIRTPSRGNRPAP